MENNKTITIWGIYTLLSSCGNVITYMKDELKFFKVVSKMDE